MVPSLTAVDGEGRPIAPGLLYGDARGHGVEGEVAGFLDWLAGEAPDAAGFWPAQAVANAALAGEGVIDSVTAMTAMPLFTGSEWDAEVTAGAGVAVERLGGAGPRSARHASTYSHIACSMSRWHSWIRAALGPGLGMTKSASDASGASGEPIRATVRSPRSRAALNPATTFGDEPLVLIARATSPGRPSPSTCLEKIRS
jgi:hypothetical protein